MKLQFIFKEKDLEDYKKWISFYPKFSKCQLKLESYWYFDPRPMIVTNITTIFSIVMLFILGISIWSLLLIPFLFIGWGELYISLPFNSGKLDSGDNSNRYGFSFQCIDSPEWHLFDFLVLCWKKKNKYIYMPWNLEFYRHSILLNNGKWEHTFYNDKERKQFYEDKWKEKQRVVFYRYLDSYDNKKIFTKVYTEEREWRRRWLMWTSLFNVIKTSIDVHFDEEVGRKKGSYKGGVMRCGYTLKKRETALECIKRMEKERKM